MAKKKYYAVKEGKVPGIYSTWDECKSQVDGFSGAKYKSFSLLEEAEQYMSNDSAPISSIIGEEKNNTQVSVEDVNKMIDNKIHTLDIDESLAFVDGSFDTASEKAGFGVIIISHGGNKDTLYKAITKSLDEDFIKLRNVAAELEGVKEAVNWAIKYNKRKITIFYDYSGIEDWANGSWRAKTNITQKYVSFINEKRNYIEIEYIKVAAHSGVTYNEEADALAKNSLLAKGHKTYNDGSVYFVGHSVNDWKTIVDIINEENIELAEDSEIINLSVENLGKRDRVNITHLGNRVVINCYSNSRSYVQGRQSVLFQKIIATAIELLKDGHSAVETLNNYHALTIKQVEVENNFEKLLPDYTESRNDKNYINLLSAVYNTMLTGYMPDYTCLVTPIFRAFEYYLHRILGKKMGLDTAKSNGTNNFAYFNKDINGKYFCTSSDIDKLNAAQADFLNEIYNSYNTVRHPYSHWSADDYDTAIITEMGPARELIEKGLVLVNKYYTLF